MNAVDENADRKLEQRAKAVFDESVASLDGQTQARLARARQAALREVEPKAADRNGRRWMPAAGLAAAALAAVGIAVFRDRSDNQTLAKNQRATPLEDMDLLAADDDLDIVQDLDFYSWLDDAAPDERTG